MVTRLLVKVWVSEVPTIVPAGAATEVITPVVVVTTMMPVDNAPKNCAADKPLSEVPCTINLLEKATLAEPSTLLPARLRAVVHLAALPVVFWLKVGKVLVPLVRSLLVTTWVAVVPRTCWAIAAGS